MAEPALYRLLTWSSPGYPTGAFSYSHGLEWAVETGGVTNLQGLLDYVTGVLERGGGWVEAVVFGHAWRATAKAGETAVRPEPSPLAVATPAATAELDTIAQLAAAF